MKKLKILIITNVIGFTLFTSVQVKGQWISPTGTRTYSFDYIGINTDYPTKFLDIAASDLYTPPCIRLTNWDEYGYYWDIQTKLDYLNYNFVYDLDFRLGNTDYMPLSTKISFLNSGDIKLYTTGSGIIFPDGTKLTTANIGGGTTSPWDENNGNVYRIDGKVGIGTTSPTSKLSIVTDGTGLPTSNRTIADITVNNTILNQEFTGLKIHTTSVGSVDITGLSVFVDNTSVGSDGNLIGGIFDVIPHADLEYGQSIGIWAKGTLGIRADGIQTGVYGYSQTGCAINGTSTSGFAGKFYGKAYFSGKVGFGTSDMADSKVTIFETNDVDFGDVTALKVTASSTGSDPDEIIAGYFDASTWSDGGSIGVKAIGYHYGVNAIGTDGAGVKGYASNGDGINGYGKYNGVFGLTESGNGVYGRATSGTGIFGLATTGFAGYFNGKSHFTSYVTIGAAQVTGNMLTVNGNILCEKVTVIDNVPSSDFVFEKDYTLMNLYELEHYIKKNKHLPEIPSAKEFKENGYSLSEMDDLLLRKVEELTLYLIELKKENEAQQMLIEEQNKKIEELQKTR
ncbi:MAG: hypothetical protein JXB49_01450 [Bacteroidales bacterium]|nr:hypothetical protein [Bacteroidales bacterium]